MSSLGVHDIVLHHNPLGRQLIVYYTCCINLIKEFGLERQRSDFTVESRDSQYVVSLVLGQNSDLTSQLTLTVIGFKTFT